MDAYKLARDRSKKLGITWCHYLDSAGEENMKKQKAISTITEMIIASLKSEIGFHQEQASAALAADLLKNCADHLKKQSIVKWTHWSRQFFCEFKLCPFSMLQLVGAAP